MNNWLPVAAAAIGWVLLFVAVILILAYSRASLAAATAVLGVVLLAYWALGAAADWWKILLSIPVGLLLLLNIRPLRVALLTRPFLKNYRRLLPSMSATEREALDAGTVGWGGERVSGGPDWPKVMSAKRPPLR